MTAASAGSGGWSEGVFEATAESGAPDTGVTVHVRRDRQVVELCVRGDLDAVGAPVLLSAWEAALRCPVGGVRIDLRGVAFCNAAGLRVLAHALDTCRARGVELELVAVGFIARTLALVGLTDPAGPWAGVAAPG